MYKHTIVLLSGFIKSHQRDAYQYWKNIKADNVRLLRFFETH